MAVKPKAKKARQPAGAKIPSFNQIIGRLYGSMLTQKQMRKQARRETNLAMQDSMRQLRTTYQRERERGLREQYAQGAYAGLLRGFGAEGSAESQAVKEAYARAAGLTGAEQRGFITPTVAQAGANVAAGQATAENLAGYTGDITSAIPGGAAAAPSGQVLNYLASLPAGTFAAEAEARAKGLGRAGAETAGQFALREAQLGQDLRELRDQYTMAVQELQAKRPGVLSEALGRYREGNRQDVATMLSAIGLQQTGFENLSQATERTTGTQLDIRKQRAAELAARGLAPDGKTPLPGFYRGSNGRVIPKGTYIAPDGSVQNVPSGYKVGPKGKLTPAPYPSSKKGAAGGGDIPSASELSTLRGNLLEEAQTRFTRFPAGGKKGVPSQSEIVNYLMKSGILDDFLSQFSGSRDRARSIAQQIAANWRRTLLADFGG
jgi:hypothetical protein